MAGPMVEAVTSSDHRTHGRVPLRSQLLGGTIALTTRVARISKEEDNGSVEARW